MNPRGYTGTKITSDGSGAHQENLRLILIDNGSKGMGIGFGPVLLQLRIVYHDNPVRPVLGQLIRKSLYIAAHKYGSHLTSQVFRQVPALTDQFKGNAVDHIVHLLREDIYTLIFF